MRIYNKISEEIKIIVILKTELKINSKISYLF